MQDQIEARVVTFLERLERALSAPLASKQSVAAAMVTHTRSELTKFADEVRSMTLTEATPAFEALVKQANAERDEARAERDAQQEIIARQRAELLELRRRPVGFGKRRNGKSKTAEARV